jgi:hypothetical protein
MGLDFNQSKASWSYRGFNSFRKILAKEIGIDLSSMSGFGGAEPWDNYNHPIIPFLNHSDCDGQLTPKECGQVGAALIKILINWPESYDRQHGFLLANDLKKCYIKNIPMVFQ